MYWKNQECIMQISPFDCGKLFYLQEFVDD